MVCRDSGSVAGVIGPGAGLSSPGCTALITVSRFAVLLVFAALCVAGVAVPAPAPDPHAAYRRQIEGWRQKREDRLKADDGWLTLAGLFWLKPGANRFGADPANEIVLPAAAPPFAGAFTLNAGRVTVDVLPGVVVTRAGQALTRAPLRTDADGAAPDILALGSLTLQIIDRNGRVAVRLKDTASPIRRSFKGLKWYPIDPAYRVTARFIAHPQPTTITVPTVTGDAAPMTSPGYVLFQLRGKSLRLDPVVESGDTTLFFILRDGTSGHTTYGAGRFLYTELPKNDEVVLDFNQAFSPPCAFTKYATCPLPPPGNRLPVAIEAGEMTDAPTH